jgi:hypothetical protein
MVTTWTAVLALLLALAWLTLTWLAWLALYPTLWLWQKGLA